MTGEKGRSLFEMANSSFVHSLEMKEAPVMTPIPNKVSSSIVDEICANYHKRLSDDPMVAASSDDEEDPPSVKARNTLQKLDGLMLEEFSTADFPDIDQEIVFDLLTKHKNRLKSLDLSNLKVSSQISCSVMSVLDMVDLEDDEFSRGDTSREFMETDSAGSPPLPTMNIRQRGPHQRRQPRVRLANSIRTLKFPSIHSPPRRHHHINRVSDREQICARLAVNDFVINCTDIAHNMVPEDNGFSTGINYTSVKTIALSRNHFPSLRELSVGSVTCLSLFFHNPPLLTYLDLSHVRQPTYDPPMFNHLDLVRFPIGCLKNTLKSLILHETEFDSNFMESQVFECLHLEVLDLSQVPSDERFSDEQVADSRLADYRISAIIERLPKLQSLDISGTNPGKKLKDEKMIIISGENGCKRIELPLRPNSAMSPSLPPWISRLPLSFLGLWGCSIDYESMDLLAHEIAGSKSPSQLLTSARKWRNEPAMAATIWNVIFDFLKNSNDPTVFLEECISIFEKYYNDHDFKLPLILSANMFYIVAPLLGDNLCPRRQALKDRVIKCLIRCINFNLLHIRVIRNCLLTLLKFRIPADLLFIYEISASTLLKILTKYQDPDLNQDSELLVQMAVQIANQIVCQVDQERKLATKKIKFIDTICQVIQRRLDFDTVDDSLKGCWSCLWNVTDEAPGNSERFIQHEGVELFLKCLKKFPEDNDLKRNIMGLVGNIAEVPYLRPHLIREETIRFYTDALQQDGDSSLEVAYNACGTLSHLMSDTTTPWPDSILAQKSEIAEMMIAAISSWDERAERNINYRSLSPIINLLKCFHCPEAQTWATWALASLTFKDSDAKYRKLTYEEGGFKALNELVFNEGTSDFVRHTANKVIERVNQFIEMP